MKTIKTFKDLPMSVQKYALGTGELNESSTAEQISEFISTINRGRFEGGNGLKQGVYEITSDFGIESIDGGKPFVYSTLKGSDGTTVIVATRHLIEMKPNAMIGNASYPNVYHKGKIEEVETEVITATAPRNTAKDPCKELNVPTTYLEAAAFLAAGSVKSTAAGSVKSTAAGSVKSTAAGSVKSTKSTAAGSVKSTAAISFKVEYLGTGITVIPVKKERVERLDGKGYYLRGQSYGILSKIFEFVTE